jgi:hypothetical protein
MTLFLALSLLAVQSRAVSAQGVTLPSIRVGGPSQEVRTLLDLLGRARTWYDSASSDRNAQTKYNMLRQVRARLLLAPFSITQLEELGASPSETEVWLKLYENELRGADASAYTAVRRMAEEFRSRPTVVGLARDTVTTRSSQKLFAQSLFKDSTIAPDKVSTEQPDVLTETESILLVEPIKQIETDDLLRQRLDTLARTARLVVIERKLTHRWLMPVHSREQAAVFWQQQGASPLNIGSITGSGNSGASFTELASPLLHAVRLSVNTVVATAKESDASSAASAGTGGSASRAPNGAAPAAASPPSETAVERFANGGGLLNLAFAWPALHYGTETGSFDYMVLLVPRIGATVPAVGGVARDSTLFADGGVELHLRSTDVVDGVGLFFQVRGATAGGTSKFGDLLGTTNGRDYFAYTNVAGGLLLGGKYLITGGRTLTGPKPLRKLGWQVGVTVVRRGTN